MRQELGRPWDGFVPIVTPAAPSQPLPRAQPGPRAPPWGSPELQPWGPRAESWDVFPEGFRGHSEQEHPQRRAGPGRTFSSWDSSGIIPWPAPGVERGIPNPTPSPKDYPGRKQQDSLTNTSCVFSSCGCSVSDKRSQDFATNNKKPFQEQVPAP